MTDEYLEEEEELKNDEFWDIVDQYENGYLTRDEAYEKLLELNDGDVVETEEDMDLLERGV